MKAFLKELTNIPYNITQDPIDHPVSGFAGRILAESTGIAAIARDREMGRDIWSAAGSFLLENLAPLSNRWYSKNLESHGQYNVDFGVVAATVLLGTIESFVTVGALLHFTPELAAAIVGSHRLLVHGGFEIADEIQEHSNRSILRRNK